MLRKTIHVVVTLLVILIGSNSLSFAGNNLLINPNAETGNAQGWVDPDNVWSAAAEITPHGGNYFFWPARGALPNTMMYQDVDVSGLASSADLGTAYLHLSGWLANWDQYPHDRSTLALEALDSNSKQLMYLSRYHRGPTWTYYRIDAQIPAGTRILRVYLIATRFVGTDNDGYFDDLSLEVDNQAPETVINVTSESNVKDIIEGGTLQLHATSNNGADSAYIWTSTFDAVATVNENGLVSAHKSGRATIQVEGTSSHATGYLEIVVYSSNSLIFASPQSGAKLGSGRTENIGWELKGALVSGTLFYSTNGGVEWTKITDVTDVTVREYSWIVPDVNTIMNDCVIKMTWNGGEAVSSGFTITPADTAGPTGTATINGGAAYTTNPDVNMTLSASDPSGVTEMQFSNDNTSWSAPETYGTAKVWSLSSEYGRKTVYVKFKDSNGNWSSAVTTTINLQPLSVNGVCGSSSGQTFTTAPTTNLCATGTSTSVSGNGPWTWSCTGSNGGTAADCTANILTLKGDVNGDDAVSLADAILTLRAIGGLNSAGIRADYATSGADVNDDNKIGLAEVIYILQSLAGLRTEQSGGTL